MKIKLFLISFSSVSLMAVPVVAISCNNESGSTGKANNIPEADRNTIKEIDKVNKELKEIQDLYFNINEYSSSGKLSVYDSLATKILGTNFTTGITTNSVAAALNSLKTVIDAERISNSRSNELTILYNLINNRLGVLRHNLEVAKEEIDENKAITSQVPLLSTIKEKLNKGEQVANADVTAAITQVYRITQDKLFNNVYDTQVQQKQISETSSTPLPVFNRNRDSHVHILGNILLDFHILSSKGLLSINFTKAKETVNALSDQGRKATATTALSNIELLLNSIRKDLTTGANANKDKTLAEDFGKKSNVIVAALQEIARLRGITLTLDTTFTPAKDDDHDHDHDHEHENEGTNSVSGHDHNHDHDHDHDHDHEHDHENEGTNNEAGHNHANDHVHDLGDVL